MSEFKAVVAANIVQLRQARGLTQAQLADLLHYSDKAVSKWERGESLPDVEVLTALADVFEVPLDYLVRKDHPAPPTPVKFRYSRRVITCVAVVLVWLIAMVAFVVMSIVPLEGSFKYLAFLYAVPPSLVVWLVLNTVWFRPRLNYWIISLLLWAVLAVVHLSLLAFGHRVWVLYLLGVPAQVIVVLWSHMKRPSRSEDSKS